MSSALSIDDLLKQARNSQDSVVLIQQGPIHFLFFNRPDFQFDPETMAAVHKSLDQVEASTGPGCLVCMGTGDRMFSTGFNLKYWAKEGVVP